MWGENDAQESDGGDPTPHMDRENEDKDGNSVINEALQRYGQGVDKWRSGGRR